MHYLDYNFVTFVMFMRFVAHLLKIVAQNNGFYEL
jgi:hypothetical protein